MPKHYKQISDFNLNNATSSGGMTGSQKVKGSDGINYQLKNSIVSAKRIRKFKASGHDHENFGEFIASHVGRVLTGSNNDLNLELVPQVDLVYNAQKKQVGIASKYLKDVQPGGTLDGVIKENLSSLGQVNSTVFKLNPKLDKATVNSKKFKHFQYTTKNYNLALDQVSIGDDDARQIRKDLANSIALSALSGDHDVNPGNMMVVKDSSNNLRIARIDFGHAFNDLINAPKIFGGRLHNEKNPVLDFFNRETIAHVKPSKRITKLWRDYDGIVPSEELLAACKNLGSDDKLKKTQEGLTIAKTAFQKLITELKQDPTNIKLVDHIKHSLIAINNNLGGINLHLNTLKNPEKVIDLVFQNLDIFYQKQHQSMKDVAQLMDLQLEVDQSIKEGKLLSPTLETKYNKLHQTAGIVNAKGIEWIKNDKNLPAFKGSLQEYRKYREQTLNAEKIPEVTKSLGQKTLSRLSNLIKPSVLFNRLRSNHIKNPNKASSFNRASSNDLKGSQQSGMQK
jgi:hypothetical protein